MRADTEETPMIAADEVDEVLDALSGQFQDALSPWEHQFVESLQRQREDRRLLTERQREKLGEVWDGFESGRRRREP